MGLPGQRDRQTKAQHTKTMKSLSNRHHGLSVKIEVGHEIEGIKGNISTPLGHRLVFLTRRARLSPLFRNTQTPLRCSLPTS